jgi:CDGSH-type Zn-finger protein
MSNTPAIGGREPIRVEVEAGKSYWWCACGLSKTQPFCDGSHNAEGIYSPVEFKAEASKPLFFCTCKRSAKQPLCDGSHKRL